MKQTCIDYRRSLWKQREADFQQEVKLSQLLNEITPYFDLLLPYLSDIQRYFCFFSKMDRAYPGKT